jgi:hypothetical protein
MQQGGMIYKAQIARVAGAKVYVKNVKGLGGADDEFGPLNVLAPILIDPTVVSTSQADSGSGTTGAGGGDSHTHSFSVTTGGHTHITNVGDALLDYLEKDDWVIVAQIGHIKEDLIVLGKLAV